jgi:hypothetical protein
MRKWKKYNKQDIAYSKKDSYTKSNINIGDALCLSGLISMAVFHLIAPDICCASRTNSGEKETAWLWMRFEMDCGAFGGVDLSIRNADGGCKLAAGAGVYLSDGSRHDNGRDEYGYGR